MNNENTENNVESVITPKNRKSKGNVIFSLFICTFLAVIFGVGILNFLDADEKFSESENRMLSLFPALTLNTVTEGTFMEKFETYLTDQFIFRDELISLKTLADRISGKKEINGVYIGSEGYLFSKPASYNEDVVFEIGEAISAFSDKYPEIKKGIMVAPDSGFVYSDYLPKYASYPQQDYQLSDMADCIDSESIQWFDITQTFENKSAETQLYYKTDHHWTTRGAYEAFKILAEEWKLDLKSVEYDFYTVSADFQGTLSSKAGVYNSTDMIEICVPSNSESAHVISYDSLQKKTATFFDESKLSQKNQYEVFLSGNFDKITVSVATLSKDTLLLIKDSYANCLIPMLTPFFNKIVVVDPRYLTDSLEAIMEENSFTHVLFLYNLNTLLEDTSLADCLES